MQSKFMREVRTILAIIVLFASCQKQPILNPQQTDEALSFKKGGRNCDSATVTVFATKLNNPRGLTFGPDGYLYVAEGGIGGTDSSLGLCAQVIVPVGPYTGSPTGGRISKINSHGVRTTLTDQLPSSMTSKDLGHLISGVADVKFIDHTLYALLAGAGCSHGVPSVPNAIVKVRHNGSWELVADLSTFIMHHHVKNPEEDDFEPDGTWYSMVSVHDDLFAVEPNHGELDKITRSGHVSRVIDISASQGHIVPTSVAYNPFNGNFYVGNLNVFPIVEGSSNIYKITPSGKIKVWATGFTTILGLVFDKHGHLYVLENTVGAPGPTPGLGRIVRVNHNGDKKVIVSNLNLPTGITVGPDGNLYVSVWGFGTPPGVGQVVKVDLPDCDDHDGNDGNDGHDDHDGDRD